MMIEHYRFFSSFFIMFNSWATIRLEPEVLTRIARDLGAPGVEVQKIYSLEDDNLFTGPNS
jgi:2-keto-4-pentenoate hydratase